MTAGDHAVFRALLKAARLPMPDVEYVFAKDIGRMWRFDYAWPRDGHVALEVEGGAFIGGRHTRGAGFIRDMEKYNAAAVRGWAVLRVVPRQLCTPATIDLLRQAFVVRFRAG